MTHPRHFCYDTTFLFLLVFRPWRSEKFVLRYIRYCVGVAVGGCTARYSSIIRVSSHPMV